MRKKDSTDGAAKVVALCLEALIKTHPDPELFRESLQDGRIDRLMEFVGEHILDPKGRARAVIAARDYLGSRGITLAALSDQHGAEAAGSDKPKG